MSIVFYFLIALALAIAFIAFVTKTDNNWSVIPHSLRIIVLPFYIFLAYYVTGLVTVVVISFPSEISWAITTFLAFLSIFGNDVTVPLTITNVIFDILVLPYIFACIVIITLVPIFKSERRYTFYYRSAVLIIYSILCTWAFFTEENFETYQRIMFGAFVIISAVFMFSIIYEDLVGTQNALSEFDDDKGTEVSGNILRKLKSCFKLIFSSENPLIQLIKRA